METIETPELEVTVERHIVPKGITVIKKEIIETLEIEISEQDISIYGILGAVCEILKSKRVKILDNCYKSNTQKMHCMVEWRHL